MLDNPGFLAAILENPEDDTPRLIYADWLEENGQPERAEFIRAQIALARSHYRLPGWQTLLDRATSLLKQFRSVWLQDLPESIETDTCRFERGFVIRIVCKVRQFVEVAAGIFRTAPVRILLIEGNQGSSVWQDFVQCPYLASLRVLNLELYPLLDSELAALVASPHVANLTHLVLQGRDGTDAFERVLIQSPYLTNLKLLKVSRFGVGSRALLDHFGDRVRFA